MSRSDLVKFFYAAQIATRLFIPNFVKFIFLLFFANKDGLFLNQPPLGIGFAQATITRLRIGMCQCAVQSHKTNI